MADVLQDGRVAFYKNPYGKLYLRYLGTFDRGESLQSILRSELTSLSKLELHIEGDNSFSKHEKEEMLRKIHEDVRLRSEVYKNIQA